MGFIIKYNMLLPTVLYLTRTVYRERDRMAREFALYLNNQQYSLAHVQGVSQYKLNNDGQLLLLNV